MGEITGTERAIIARLQADLIGIEPLTRTVRKGDGSTVEAPIKVESYPKKPQKGTLKTLAASGAVLVRYTGSKYKPPRRNSRMTVQDRQMFFELLIVADSLLAEDQAKGIYESLDLAADRVLDYVPPGCTAGIELVQDDYLNEQDGSWEYGLLISVWTQKVREV